MMIKVTHARNEKDAKEKLEYQYKGYTISFIKKEVLSDKTIFWFDLEMK